MQAFRAFARKTCALNPTRISATSSWGCTAHFFRKPYIADESHRQIKVNDVVTHTHASHRSLVRHFQQVRGRTIVEELTRIRIGRVKRQLVESDMPSKEIAASCGFTSSNRLCKNFRTAEGLTPGEYRIRHAKINEPI